MNDKLKKRIIMFYAAGVVNLAVGVYVLLFGRGFLPDDKVTILLVFFLGFAALDFWMPHMMKKKWQEDQAKLEAQRKAQNTQGNTSPPQT
jgi:hypothetical protein